MRLNDTSLHYMEAPGEVWGKCDHPGSNEDPRAETSVSLLSVVRLEQWAHETGILWNLLLGGRKGQSL